MQTKRTRLAACCAVLLLVAGTAAAEVSVSITISGDIDELIPILEHLRQYGPDMGAQSESAQSLRFHILSESKGETQETEQPAQTAAPKTNTLGLHSAAVEPNKVKAGETILVKVSVTDPNRRVDTVGMSIDGTSVSADLLDKGKEGDEKAADGVYSRAVTLPDNMVARDYTVTITAYDRNGDPLKVVGGDGSLEPVETQVKLSVVDTSG